MNEIASSIRNAESVFHDDELGIGQDREIDVASEMRKLKKKAARRSVELAKNRLSKVSKRREFCNKLNKNLKRVNPASSNKKKKLLLHIGVDDISRDMMNVSTKEKFSKMFQQYELHNRNAKAENNKFKACTLGYYSQKSLPEEDQTNQFTTERESAHFNYQQLESREVPVQSDGTNRRFRSLKYSSMNNINGKGNDRSIRLDTKKIDIDIDFSKYVSPPISSMRNYLSCKDKYSSEREKKESSPKQKKVAKQRKRKVIGDFKKERLDTSGSHNARRKTKRGHKGKYRAAGKLYSTKYALDKAYTSNYPRSINQNTKSRLDNFKRKYNMKKPKIFDQNSKTLMNSLTSKAWAGGNSKANIRRSSNKEAQGSFCRVDLKKKNKKNVMDYIKDVNLRQSNYTTYSNQTTAKEKINFLKDKLNNKRNNRSKKGPTDERGYTSGHIRRRKKDKKHDRGEFYGYLFGDQEGREKVVKCFLTGKR